MQPHLFDRKIHAQPNYHLPFTQRFNALASDFEVAFSSDATVTFLPGGGIATQETFLNAFRIPLPALLTSADVSESLTFNYSHNMNIDKLKHEKLYLTPALTSILLSFVSGKEHLIYVHFCFSSQLFLWYLTLRS